MFLCLEHFHTIDNSSSCLKVLSQTLYVSLLVVFDSLNLHLTGMETNRIMGAISAQLQAWRGTEEEEGEERQEFCTYQAPFILTT